MMRQVAFVLVACSCTATPSVQQTVTFGGAGNDEVCKLIAGKDDVTIVGTVSGPAMIGDEEFGVARVQGDERRGNAAFIATHRRGVTSDVAGFDARDDAGGVGNVFGVAALHRSDTTYLAGTFSGALNIEGANPANAVGLFIGRRRGTTIDWLRTFSVEVEGTPLEREMGVGLTRVAGIVEAGTELMIVVQFFGTLDLGDGAIGEQGIETLLAVRIAGDGEIRSSRVLLSRSAAFFATSVVAAGNGHLLIVGGVAGDAVDFGTGQLVVAAGGSAFALCIDADGLTRWATLLPGKVDPACYGAAGANTPVLALGSRAWIATEVLQPGEINGEAFIPDGVDVLLTSVDVSTGIVQEIVLHGGDGEERAPSLLAGREGGIYLVGSFRDSTHLGDIEFPGGSGVFLIDADASGNMRSAYTLARNVWLRSTASTGDGKFWIGGVFNDEALVGETSVFSGGANDGVLALIVP